VAGDGSGVKHRADFGAVVGVVVTLFAFGWAVVALTQSGARWSPRWDVEFIIIIAACLSTDLAVLFAANQYDETRNIGPGPATPLVGWKPRIMARPGAHLRRLMEGPSREPESTGRGHAFDVTIAVLLILAWSPLVYLLI
jgi:hypothetical protein